MYRHRLQVLLHCLHGQFHHLNLPHIWILCPGSGLCLCLRKWCRFQSWCSGWCYFPGWCCHYFQYFHLWNCYCSDSSCLLRRMSRYGHTILAFYEKMLPLKFLCLIKKPESYRYTYHFCPQHKESTWTYLQVLLLHLFLHTDNHILYH